MARATFVQSGSNETNVTTLAVTLSSNPAAGNCLMALILGGGATGITSAGGTTWSLVKNVTNPASGAVVEIWAAFNCTGGSGDKTISLTFGGYPNAAVVFEVAGLPATSSLDGQHTQHANLSAGSITTAVDGELIVAVMGNANSITYPGGAWSDPEGKVSSGGLGYLDAIYEIQSSAGTTSATWTGTSGNPASIIASFEPAPSVPNAPVIGTASGGAVSSEAATVTWTNPAHNGNSPILGWVITPYILSAAQTPITVLAGLVGSVLDPTTGASDSYTVTGLTIGTAYTFTVEASNSLGSSAASSESNSVTPYTYPSIPATPSAKGSASTITLSWVVPSNGWSAVTVFTVTYYVNGVIQTPIVLSAGGVGSALDPTPGANDSYQLNGVTPSDAYTFTIGVTTSVGSVTSQISRPVVLSVSQDRTAAPNDESVVSDGVPVALPFQPSEGTKNTVLFIGGVGAVVSSRGDLLNWSNLITGVSALTVPPNYPVEFFYTKGNWYVMSLPINWDPLTNLYYEEGSTPIDPDQGGV